MRGWRQWPDAALRTVEMVRLAAWAAVEHDALTVAQATAYSAMVALFPALIVAAAFVAWVPDTTPLRAQMAQFFDQVLPSNVTPLLETYFSPAHRSAHTVRALLGAVVVSATGASSVMLTLMEGFRRAYALPLAPRSFWPRRVRSLALVPVSLVPLAGASLLVVFGHFISQWLAGEVTPELRVPVLVVSSVMRWTIAFAGSVGIIAVIYHLGTDLTKHMREHLEPLLREPWGMLRKDWSWRASLPGAALATVLWLGSTLWVVRDALCGLLEGVRVSGRGDCIDVLVVHYRAERAAGCGVQCAAGGTAGSFAFGVFEEAAGNAAATASGACR
jgi:membrane protein